MPKNIGRSSLTEASSHTVSGTRLPTRCVCDNIALTAFRVRQLVDRRLALLASLWISISFARTSAVRPQSLPGEQTQPSLAVLSASVSRFRLPFSFNFGLTLRRQSFGRTGRMRPPLDYRPG